MAIKPTDEDVKRARKMCAWAASGLEIFRHKLACEFALVRETAERGADKIMAERDDREEQVGDMALQAGCDEEFSNLHDHRTCVSEGVALLKGRLMAAAMEIREARADWEAFRRNDGSLAAELGRIAAKCEDGS